VTVVIVVLAVLIILALVAWRQASRRKALRSQFGSEYDRTVAETGQRSKAERELEQRTARHESLRLRSLEPVEQEQFSRQWQDAQALFVDNPAAAVAQADTLVQVVMGRRGYPAEPFEQRTADLSVEHSELLDDYREAHDIASRLSLGRTSTEDMRRAMVLYGSVFGSLLGRSDQSVGQQPQTSPSSVQQQRMQPE
jgi:hypothetical protein